MNYDLYHDLLETAVQGLDFHNDAIPIKGVIPHNLRMPMNQLEGVQHDIPRMIDMMPKATREDYENIVLRLERVGSADRSNHCFDGTRSGGRNDAAQDHVARRTGAGSRPRFSMIR